MLGQNEEDRCARERLGNLLMVEVGAFQWVPRRMGRKMREQRRMSR